MQAVTFTESIKKYNPYHDAKGRFSGAKGATLFSLGGGAAGQRTIEREKEKYVVQAPPPKAEEKYRKIESDEEGMQYADTAAQSQALTNREMDAILEYTGSGHLSINAVLRGRGTSEWSDGILDDLSKQELKTVKKQTKLLESAIAKNTIHENIVVYRGAEIGALGMGGKTKLQDMVGKTIEDQAFMSTSLSRERADIFTRAGGVMFEISIQKGTNGLLCDGNSNHERECEVLLQKGSRLKITGVKQHRTKESIVYAEYV